MLCLLHLILRLTTLTGFSMVSYHGLLDSSQVSGFINPGHFLRTLPTQVYLVKAVVFPVVMCECESWTIKKAEHWRIWCFWTVVLEKTLESPLDFKEIQPVNHKGNQSWLLIGRTNAKAEAPILWPPNAKSWLIRKDPDAGKGWSVRRRRRWDDWMTSLSW